MAVDNENTDPGENQSEAGWIKELRKKAKQADKLQEENANLKRQNAINEVGLDTDDKMVKLFVDSYDGDWDAESLKEAASEYDLLSSDEGEEEQVSEEQQQEQAAHQRVNAASQGAGNDNSGGDQKPWLEANNPEEFMAQYDGQVLTE